MLHDVHAGHRQDDAILSLDGLGMRLAVVVDAAREICKDAVYQPFPELERLTR